MTDDARLDRAVETMQASAAALVGWVRAAAPYIHDFRGRTFVIGVGGEVVEGDCAQRFAYDCNVLAALGIRLVLVHGARPQIERELVLRGLGSRLHQGLRVTDAEALEAVKAGLSVTRLEIEALLSQGLPNTPMAGSYMRVTGGNFITARPVGVVDGVDYQYTGAVRKVLACEITADLDQQNVVLISSIGVSPSGELFNLSMESVAEAVAMAIKADKLVFLGDDVVLEDEQGERIDALTADDASQWLAGAAPVPLSDDLRLYLPCAIRALRAGVGRVHLVERGDDGGLLLEFFTHGGVGTLVTRAPLYCLRDATVDDVGALVALIAPLEAEGALVRRSRELLEQEIERFCVVEHDGVLVGCAALYPFSNEAAAELACLAVMPEYRAAGLGAQLLNRIERRARTQRLRQLFVLTTRTAHWFIEHGFVEASPDVLPPLKRDLYNYQRRSKVLVKSL